MKTFRFVFIDYDPIAYDTQIKVTKMPCLKRVTVVNACVFERISCRRHC